MAEKVQKRYFAQVGSELIEVAEDEVALHKKDVPFNTSVAPAYFKVVATLGESRYEGTGATWKAAEEAVDKQVPK